MRYDFLDIEERWQNHWASHGTFKAPNPGDSGFDADKPKYYVLDMFPYPSGVGLHVGHPLGYIATDIVCRYHRMKGFNVLHPMGYDAFGLPAEQFAVEQGVHPRITTEQNIANMTRQLKRLGLSYDWDRCISTTDPDYYHWTQWIFLQLFNSWYDPAQRKARPIAQLVLALENNRYFIGLGGELVPASAQGMTAIEGVPAGCRKWTEWSAEEQRQWLDDQRLAYLAEVPVNWCPALGTVLANEEVTNDGRSERGNHPVYRRPLKQWMLRITAYADRLAEDLELVDWPESVKALQRNWIGRSEGAKVDFSVSGQPDQEPITVFTTRPDTLFGATYMVLAPEHPLVDSLVTGSQKAAIEAYRQQAAAKADIDRQAENKEKTGVFTGAYAINPVNGQTIPIWVADYVLMGYGTGAIMAVPAHDERDFDFAKAFNLPIRAVVQPDDRWLAENSASLNESAKADLNAAYLADAGQFAKAFTGIGAAINSANHEVSLNGSDTPTAKKKITVWLAEKELGQPCVQYKLRDWLFSRQRYWGEPFPILHGPDGQIIAVDESELPVRLPEMTDFRPAASDDPSAPPLPPLSRAPDDWKYVKRNGVTYTREFNTMPQWAGSCWYYLRYLDPKNARKLADHATEKYWMVDPAKTEKAERTLGGVDLYVGGVEHAVLHLLYARFWHKVLFDLGHVSTPEPFARLFNQGYIQAYAYVDERGIYVDATQVVDQDGQPAMDVQSEPGRKFFYQGKPVSQQYGKMGKSLKNAIAPDQVCQEYGCDTLRLYEMSMGPLDQSKAWNTRDIAGVHRFLQRLWRLLVNEETDQMKISDHQPAEDLQRLLHKTLKRVTQAMDDMGYNVAIAAMIELNNDLVKRYGSDQATDHDVPRSVVRTLLLMLSPLAPHIAEELWRKMGHPQTIAYEPWPSYDEKWLVESQIEYPIQINGKLRGRVTMPAEADQKAIEQAAKNDPRIASLLEGKSLKKVILVKGKLINLVVG